MLCSVSCAVDLVQCLPPVLREFGDCFTKIAGDKECRAVVLTGSGKNFCGGEGWAVEGCLVT